MTVADPAEPAPTAPESRPLLGFVEATGIGVGAIVGGGVLVLAGTAFAQTGPAAVVAFALNGLIALVTARSVATVARTFPESGGTYAFARRVLSVRAAFAVGWILWFAHIVAAVLYALGFASYGVAALDALARAGGLTPAPWLSGHGTTMLFGVAAASVYAVRLVRPAGRGGLNETVGKLVVFGIIVAAGTVALARQPLATTRAVLSPVFPGGIAGLVSAMGFTFIALQGFEIIAAVGGEVRDAPRIVPRAMNLSLGIALLVYLPLLFLVASVGVGPDQKVAELARAHPDTVMAIAVERFMGGTGYWLVVVAAILSTLSALHANLLAASRISFAMARDRVLPSILRQTHSKHGTPVMAIYASTVTLVATLLMVPNLAAAGAAASLIFLVTFAIAHVLAILVRRRDEEKDGSPRRFILPVLGGVACALLASFQALVVPAAGGVVLVWLAFGVMLYLALFAGQAETWDASSEALDPALVRFRGRSPLVLVPIANPAQARALIAVANALAPAQVGRVLLLTILPPPTRTRRDELELKLAYAHDVIHQSLTTSFAMEKAPEVLITSAAVPWDEIHRVARAHSCESLLLGLGELRPGDEAPLERLVNRATSDVALLRAPEGWTLEGSQKILVPVGGRGDQHELRARFLGSICRASAREVTFLRVLSPTARAVEIERARREVERLADLPGRFHVRMVQADAPLDAILAEARGFSLVVLGLERAAGRAAFSPIALDIVRRASCASILLSQKA